jgi:hypothetical protein
VIVEAATAAAGYARSDLTQIYAAPDRVVFRKMNHDMLI